MGNLLCFNCSDKSNKQNFMDDININLNNFIKLYEIGKGGFGIV